MTNIAQEATPPLSFEALNHEVRQAQRYTGVAGAETVVAGVSANPELQVFARYAAAREQAAARELLGINPELMAFQRYAAARNGK